MEHRMSDITIPKFDFTGKTALITGGTKGLGYGMALTLATYGADVAVSSRTKRDCDRVSEEIRSLGRKSMGIVADVTKPEQNVMLTDTVVREFGKIDIMICNAGVANTAKALDMTEEQWDKVIDIDLKGVFFSAREAAKRMVEAGNGGRIILTASAASFTGSSGISHYCAAKGGVLNMAKALAVEWARYRITVNCICPGYVPTTINEDTISDPAVKKKLEMHTPLRRLGTIDEITGAVLYLASDYSGYMTGSHILIDGGGAAQ